MNRLLAELKRRNVFKVATIYVVVSWLLLQVATVIFPVFDIPNWASRLVVILLALGFPVALLLAWAFDLTPEGIEWQSKEGEHHVHTHAWDWVIAVLLVVAIGVMVSMQIEKWSDDALSEASVAAPVATMPAPDPQPVQANAIAILPFDNLSPDADDEYFAVGLAEELLSVLGRIRELKVASRTSTAYFDNRDVDHREIGSALGVDSVLSGSVRRDSDTIRVTTALDRAQTGELLWADTYDRTFEDILQIQSEIARSVAAAVVPVLSPASRQRIQESPTKSSEAFDFYLRGRHYLRRPTGMETLSSAIELFDRAISLDPAFAEAHAGRCEANLRSFDYTREPVYFENAERSCHRALTLDDALWDVHLALGNLYRANGQYDEAGLEYEAAIARQPNAVEPYVELGRALAAGGRDVEAESMLLKAEGVESSYWRLHNELGIFYESNARYDEAILRYRRVADLAPDTGIGQDNLGNTYLSLGNVDAAIAAFNESPSPSRWTYTNRGLAFYYRGDFEQAAEDQRNATELAPEVDGPWGRLGDALRHIPGSEAESRDAYLRAIELTTQEYAINPAAWLSAVRLAMYYAHSDDEENARRFLARTLELTSDHTALYFAAIAEMALGNREAALTHVVAAAEGGFSPALILNDPDFAPLHGDQAFDRAMVAAGN